MTDTVPEQALELGNIQVGPGLDETGAPHVTVVALSADNTTVLYGRLPPEDAITTALGWLRAAETALFDSALGAALAEVDHDDPAAFLALVNQHRQQRADGYAAGVIAGIAADLDPS